mmetsp:Transcript_35461/g.92363  ORF Transcript_35461/g.92363 Transcript_35461/m.92363 type:complete len:772 (-) Transcript_35461:131-2446(-)
MTNRVVPNAVSNRGTESGFQRPGRVDRMSFRSEKGYYDVPRRSLNASRMSLGRSRRDSQFIDEEAAIEALARDPDGLDEHAVQPEELTEVVRQAKRGRKPVEKFFRYLFRLDKARTRTRFRRQHLYTKIWCLIAMTACTVLSIISSGFAVFDLTRASAEGRSVDRFLAPSTYVKSLDLFFMPPLLFFTAFIMGLSAIVTFASGLGVALEKFDLLLIGDILLPTVATALFCLYYAFLSSGEMHVDGVNPVMMVNTTPLPNSLRMAMQFASGSGVEAFYAGELLRYVPWTSENLRAIGFDVDSAPARWNARMDKMDSFWMGQQQSLYFPMTVTIIVFMTMVLMTFGTVKDDILLIISRDKSRCLNSLDTRPASAVRMERNLAVLEKKILRHLKEERRERRRARRKAREQAEAEENAKMRLADGVDDEDMAQLQVPVTLAWLRAAAAQMEGRDLNNARISISLGQEFITHLAKSMKKDFKGDDRSRGQSIASTFQAALQRERSSSMPEIFSPFIDGLVSSAIVSPARAEDRNFRTPSPGFDDEEDDGRHPATRIRRMSLPSNVSSIAKFAAKVAEKKMIAVASAAKRSRPDYGDPSRPVTGASAMASRKSGVRVGTPSRRETGYSRQYSQYGGNASTRSRPDTEKRRRSEYDSEYSAKSRRPPQSAVSQASKSKRAGAAQVQTPARRANSRDSEPQRGGGSKQQRGGEDRLSFARRAGTRGAGREGGVSFQKQDLSQNGELRRADVSRLMVKTARSQPQLTPSVSDLSMAEEIE